MKPFFLIALFLTVISNSYGQYFQHNYGSPDDERSVTGVNTFIQPQGHLMAAIVNPISGSGRDVTVTYADFAGTITGAPNFNNRYSLATIAGNVLYAASANVFEMENGSGFGVVGLYFDGASSAPNGIYYLQLDPMGNVMAAYDYTPVASGAPVSWYNLTDVSSVAKSPGTDDLYITGSTETNLGKNFIYALKINTVSGGLLWSSFYDIVQSGFPQKEFARDIIESPYMPLGVQEVVIVGGCYEPGMSLSFDGFFIRVDATTGTPTFPWAIMYGSRMSNEAINSIAVAQSPTGGSGFILGGYTNYQGSYDYWLIKTDPTGGTIWANTYDYSMSPGNTDECWDVIERFNTMGQYEYYAGGHTNNGGFGSYDVVVIKTDDMGNGVAGGEFTYNTGNNDLCRSLDQYNGTPYDGLSVYGLTENGLIGNYDIYTVKAYFNGISGCNESFSTPMAVNAPGLYSETSLNYFDNYTDFILSYSVSSLSDANLCSSSSIIGGNNARIAPTEPKGDKEAIVSPNPMAQGTPVAMVDIETETPVNVQVTIYDMLGKQYYNAPFTLVKGTNQLPVNLSTANMAAGMYTVRISSTTINKNILLMVK